MKTAVKIIAIVAIALCIVLALPEVVHAARLDEIPEMGKKDRPFGLLPWLPGVVLGLLALLTAFKDAKRSHMD